MRAVLSWSGSGKCCAGVGADPVATVIRVTVSVSYSRARLGDVEGTLSSVSPDPWLSSIDLLDLDSASPLVVPSSC